MMVRAFVDEDLGWIIEQLGEFWDESGGWSLGGVPSRAAAYYWLRDQIDNHSGIVAQDRRGRAGFLTWSEVTDKAFPGSKILSATHWWVSRSRRGGSAGLSLIRAFNEIVKSTGATHSVITLAKNSEVSENTMSRIGFALSNFVYIRGA